MTLSISFGKFREFEAYLQKNGYVFEERPSQQFLAKNAGISINLYNTGKILFGGSNKAEIARVEEYLLSLTENKKGAANIRYAGDKIILESPYNKAFVSELKSGLQYHRWVNEEKRWIFDNKERQKLLEIARKFFPVVEHNPPAGIPISEPYVSSEPIESPSILGLSSVLKPGAEVEIWTDGACVVNPGPGGYGVMIKWQGQKWEIAGGFRQTTNNRMEITAALVALKALPEKCKAVVYSDSSYLVKGSKWAKRWESNDWMRKDRKTKDWKKVVNADLWEEMLQLLAQREVKFKHIQGHSGIIENEVCDQLAESAARKPGLPADWGYGADEVDETDSSSSELDWI